MPFWPLSGSPLADAHVDFSVSASRYTIPGNAIVQKVRRLQALELLNRYKHRHLPSRERVRCLLVFRLEPAPNSLADIVKSFLLVPPLAHAARQRRALGDNPAVFLGM